MPEFSTARKDREPPLAIKLVQGDGTNFDLSGWVSENINFILRDMDSGEIIVEEADATIDVANAVVKLTPSPETVRTIRRFKVVVELHNIANSPPTRRTFPEPLAEPIYWNVGDDISDGHVS